MLIYKHLGRHIFLVDSLCNMHIHKYVLFLILYQFSVFYLIYIYSVPVSENSGGLGTTEGRNNFRPESMHSEGQSGFTNFAW